MWSASDESLLAGVAGGDATAATALVRRYQRRVYGLARTILCDGAAAEDVAQEAFVRMWRHAAAYDARRGSVASWLLTITRNLAIDALRIRRAEPTAPETLLALNLVATSPAPEDAAVADAEIARVRAALAALPVEQARAVVRAAFLGQTAREIGTVEGIPLGTAKTRIRSGLIKLHAALQSAEAAP
ncbi:MAG: RNA polymerase sigma factor [Mycobacteriales bacterium]|nr:sigma-70 family RNA polymerase sigma factor [Frankia sp.]